MSDTLWGTEDTKRIEVQDMLWKLIQRQGQTRIEVVQMLAPLIPVDQLEELIVQEEAEEFASPPEPDVEEAQRTFQPDQ